MHVRIELEKETFTLFHDFLSHPYAAKQLFKPWAKMTLSVVKVENLKASYLEGANLVLLPRQSDNFLIVKIIETTIIKTGIH